MVNANKEYEQPSASELPENNLRHNFRLGDMTWVKHSSSSWWPAQVYLIYVSEFKVIDEACLGSKPKKKGKYDCLVRLYGTCQYLYVDPWKSNTEFKMMLKQESRNATEVFREVLEKELSCLNSSDDNDEERDNSEGTKTKATTKKASSRKVKKQQGLKQCSDKDVKKAATAENMEDESDQNQEVGSTATTGATVQKGKRKGGRKSTCSHDTVQPIDKGKRLKQAAHMLDKEGCKIGDSVVIREGLRRSARSSAKECLDPAEDRTASLTDTGASEDAIEDSMLHETSTTEIKAMVRDLLFKEVIDREHDAEMAFVDDVINGICSANVDSMTGPTTASMKDGEGIEQNDTGVQGESSNVTERDTKGQSGQATMDTMQVIKQNDTGVQGESSNVTERDTKGKSDQATMDTMQVINPETGNHVTDTENNSKDNVKVVFDTTTGCSDEGTGGT